VDERFGITQEQVREAAKKAEDLWEKASGKNVFEYDESRGLPIQFVYDERQQKTQAEQALQARLENIDVETSEERVNRSVAQFEQAKRDYERKLSQYEQNVEAYNKRVERINKSGGATESQQKDLAKEHENLQDEFQSLETAREKVNTLAGSTNQQITSNQNLVETYNNEITTFQEQYGGEGEAFDQGVYTGSDITIYQYDDEQRLILVLAHELGHALGIEHGEDPEGIMYYLMRDQNIDTLNLHDSDLESLQNICQLPQFPWAT
jgi:vacuolar-type H+-ATPase subunit I/STV1